MIETGTGPDVEHMKTTPKTPLGEDQLKHNFADLHAPYSRDEAVAEASRCQFCYDAPCMRACPTHIDVAKFIRQILHDNTLGAAKTIFTENVFGGSCGRACPTEVLCEGACVDRTLLKEPIHIGRLQRYATDHAQDRKIQFFEAGAPTGRKVAVIGAGPAGLSCAHELRRAGHFVTVYDSREIGGGLNTLGIAAYKISTEDALKELDYILEIGIDLALNTPVDGPRLTELLTTHDAVFLGIGLGQTSRMNLPGEEADGVWEALDFVFQTHRKPYSECQVGRNVLVIGAGNTAVDCATEAVRLGAESVTISYRRTAAEMSAYKYEYELAKSDGVQFEWNAMPVEFVQESGRLTGVKFQRVACLPGSRSTLPEPVPGSEYVIPCDMAIKALGQVPLADFIRSMPGLQFERGRLLVDRNTGYTGVPGLYAGGDCISKGAEIVNAVQEGKIAARAMHARVSAPAYVSPVSATVAQAVPEEV